MESYIDIYRQLLATDAVKNHLHLDKHYKHLIKIDQFLPIANSFFMLVNTLDQRYDYVSQNFKHLLGYETEKMIKEGPEFWLSVIHPQDRAVWLRIIDDLVNFTMAKVKPEDRTRLVYTFNYRVKHLNGNYQNFHTFLNTLELDDHGKPVLAVSHYTAIGKDEERPMIGSIKMLNDNDVYETLFYKNYTQIDFTEALTKRERDIVLLLSLNKTSKEIGEKLFISSHTVDKHRRNILKKLNFKSTGELIQYCKSNPVF